MLAIERVRVDSALSHSYLYSSATDIRVVTNTRVKKGSRESFRMPFEELLPFRPTLQTISENERGKKESTGDGPALFKSRCTFTLLLPDGCRFCCRRQWRFDASRAGCVIENGEAEGLQRFGQTEMRTSGNAAKSRRLFEPMGNETNENMCVCTHPQPDCIN